MPVNGMNESRTAHSRRNLISGFARQAQAIVMPFAVRTVMLYVLGVQYQGLNSLFGSILQVLSLADLGFSTAVMFVLYQPVAEKDWDAVSGIVAYLRKVYRIIGTVIMAAGLVILPFIPKLITGTYPAEMNIYCLYLLHLANAAISYWLFAYKEALLTAMQRGDLVSNVYTLTKFLLRVTQIVILFVTKNYYVFLAVQPLFTVISNLLIQKASVKYFSQIVPRGEISAPVRRELSKQVKAVFINRVGDVARNGCDSVFLSAFLGLTTLAIYDNYYYIFLGVYSISLVVTNAIQASVGNSVAQESKEKNYRDLRRFTFLYSWFTGWCTICLCCLYQPFVRLWMNGNMALMLSDENMVLFCLYFYIITMNNTRNLYVNAAGLYWELRLWFVLEAVGNVVLNAVLGYFFGVTGIILATIITVFICNFVTRTNVLFKHYFQCSPRGFYGQHACSFLVMLISCAATCGLCSLVPWEGVYDLAARAVICLIVPNGLFVLTYGRSDQMKESVPLIKALLRLR